MVIQLDKLDKLDKLDQNNKLEFVVWGKDKRDDHSYGCILYRREKEKACTPKEIGEILGKLLESEKLKENYIFEYIQILDNTIFDFIKVFN